MKSKVLFFIVLFVSVLSLTSCGYNSVYSSKNFSISISQLNYQESKLNNKFARIIKSISNQESRNGLNLTFDSKQSKRILSKDKNGEPAIFEVKMEIIFKVNNEEKTLLTKENFNNDVNKFKLNQFEKQIEEQMIENITLQILEYLSSIK